jgi:hypothetical protein
LRNTPYSTVRHSRVFRGSDSIERRGDDFRSDRRLDESDGYSDRSIGSSLSLKGTPTKLSEKLFSADAEIWPTPKGNQDCDHGDWATALTLICPSALFHDSPNESKLSPATRSLFPSSNIKSSGLSLEEAAKCGDFERCAHLAVELLRVARQGDADAVLEIVSSKKSAGGSSRSGYDVKFSPHISVIHEFQHGIKVEQVKAEISVSESTADPVHMLTFL